MRWLVTVGTALALLGSCRGADEDNGCWTCASEHLKTHWAMTGFPTKLEDKYFTEACRDPVSEFTDKTTTLGKEYWVGSCNTFCATLYIELTPASEMDVKSRSAVWVRGCHATLVAPIQVQLSAFPEGSETEVGYKQKSPNSGIILFGTVQRADPANSGKLTDFYQAIQICSYKTGENIPCNKIVGIDNKARFAADPFDIKKVGASSVSTLYCDTCTQFYHNCKKDGNVKQCVTTKSNDASTATATTGARYCFKSAGYEGDRWMERKGCAPFSVIYPGATQPKDVCVTTKSQGVSPSIQAFDSIGRRRKRSSPTTLSYEGKTCWCKGNKCNSGVGSIGLSLGLLLTAAAGFVLR